MRKGLLKLCRSERASTLLEFALLAPVFCTFVIAIGNFGILFFAKSGLSAAVAEGARYASIHPRPTNAQIIARINERRYGMNSAGITGPTITEGVSGGRAYVDIQMSYKATLNFVFFNWSTQDMVETRRVFTYTNL
jgi:Flp pilus assembly protein TadG